MDGQKSAAGAMEALGQCVITLNAECVMVAKWTRDFGARLNLYVVLLTEDLRDTSISHLSPPARVRRAAIGG